MKEFGQIPADKLELKELLYPFYKIYPQKLWSKYRWWKNSKLRILLPTLNFQRKTITVVDRLGAPGDALITANVIRGIKIEYPNLKINCITPTPSLLERDPNIDFLNLKETFYSFDSTYWELIVRKERQENIVANNLNRLGISNYNYKASYYMTKEEEKWATKEIADYKKSVIAICTKSKESVKNWPYENWVKLVKNLEPKFTLLHLGDEREPIMHNVIRQAGKLTMRKSASLLSKAKLFIGPDSLLMHIANGLNIPSVIIFGGSRPAKCFGYDDNINLIASPECSPCWIHDGYDTCNYSLKCLNQISVTTVLQSVDSLLKNNSK